MGFGKLEWRLIALAICALLFAQPAFAAVPIQVTYPSDSKLQIPFYAQGELGNCKTSCLGFQSSLIGAFHDIATYTNLWANYTNFALGAASNPAQSFAVGMNRVVANLSAIATNGVEFQVISRTTFTLGMPSITTFTPGIHFQGPSKIPIEVDTTVGALKTPTFVQNYVTTAAAFTACSAPCVFSNSANNTVVVKLPTTLPTTVDFLFSGSTNPGLTLGIGIIVAIVVGFMIVALFVATRRRRRY